MLVTISLEISWTILNFTTVNSPNTFASIIVCGCLPRIIAQFKLAENKFPNYTMVHVHLCGFQIRNGVKKSTRCQHTNYHGTINHGEKIFSALTA